MTKDPIGDRLKRMYEDVFRAFLPRNTYAILRIDGKAFHTFTRGLERPYDKRLADCLDAAAMTLCKEMMGAKFAYGQSDEYSFLFTDFDQAETEMMWFGGNIQKIVSVSASIFTASFNAAWSTVAPQSIATFDARAFIIPNRADVERYFVWRQLDASRNSLNMLASAHFGHKDLHGKGTKDKHDMLHSLGVNWNDCGADFKRGRVVRREPSTREVTFTHKRTKEVISTSVEETTWAVDLNIPIFTKDQAYLSSMIPFY